MTKLFIFDVLLLSKKVRLNVKRFKCIYSKQSYIVKVAGEKEDPKCGAQVSRVNSAFIYSVQEVSQTVKGAIS